MSGSLKFVFTKCGSQKLENLQKAGMSTKGTVKLLHRQVFNWLVATLLQLDTKHLTLLTTLTYPTDPKKTN